MKQVALSFFIIINSLMLYACTQAIPNTPLTVAQAFWNASLAGDIDTAKQFLTPQSKPQFELILSSPKDFIELGEQKITSSRAEILTQLTRHKDNRPYNTALRTVLINQQGQWLIDFEQTRSSMLGSQLQSVFEQLSTTMQETIDKSVQIMGESVKEELHQMERSLQDVLQELDKELEQQELKKNQTAPESTTL